MLSKCARAHPRDVTLRTKRRGGEKKKSPAPRAWGEVGALGECLVSGAARRLVKVADSGEERMWTPAEPESRLSPRA